jgi:hypothetical protein
MALDATLVGSNIDAGGNVKTALTLTPAQMGGVRLFSEVDLGSVTGSPLLRSPEVSNDFRLRVGIDNVWDSEQFNYTAQNTSKHKYTSTTMTMTWAGGTLNTNGSSITTTATAAQIQTYRNFPLLGSGVLYVETTMCLSNSMTTNTNVDFGLFTPAAAGTSIPTDGVYFRINNGGVFGVLNNNGTEVTTSAFTFTQTINVFNKFTIAVSQSDVEFWIDDVLMGVVARQASASQPIYAASAPYAIRHHNVGVAGAVVQAKFGGYSIALGDTDNARLWASAMAGAGQSGIQGQSGHTQGQTANNANSAAPAAATLSNTAAGYTTLGGKFQFAAVAGAETDYALFAFLNPVPTNAISGRNLVIRGVWIDTVNAVVAVATTPTVLEWSLGAGSTGVSLATAEAAATRAPRRLTLGTQSFVVGALAGQAAARIDVNLDAPVVVEPGTYVHVILRMPYGTATATEVFRGQVGFNCYWE